LSSTDATIAFHHPIGTDIVMAKFTRTTRHIALNCLAFGPKTLAALFATGGMLLSPLPASADEVEDMLVRLIAAGANNNSSDGLTSVTAANGIIGAIVSGSANGSQGIMALNQDASLGGANQANVVVVAVSHGPNAAALARLLAEQSVAAEVPAAGTVFADQNGIAALAIIDSYKGGSGIAQVNQNAGVGNVQRNATIIAAALGGGDASAMTEADLAAQGSMARSSSATGTTRGLASIAGSFTDFSGVVQVNQTIGTGNLVSNTVTMTYGGPAGGGG
jgi:hypothetical protein